MKKQKQQFKFTKYFFFIIYSNKVFARHPLARLGIFLTQKRFGKGFKTLHETVRLDKHPN